jgi:hypothetical protein
MKDCGKKRNIMEALDWDEWSASRSGPFTPGGKRRRYPFYRRLGGRQSRCDTVKKGKFLISSMKSNPGHPVRSLSLYLLRYPGSKLSSINSYKTKAMIQKKKLRRRIIRTDMYRRHRRNYLLHYRIKKNILSHVIFTHFILM